MTKILVILTQKTVVNQQQKNYWLTAENNCLSEK